MRSARRTGVVRRIELVRVAQLALISRTSTQRARVKSEGMSTRSRRLRWWEGGSQWEASQGSHARCAGSVRAVVGSGQGGQAHPSCPVSARFQHFDPEESRTCALYKFSPSSGSS